MKDSSTVTNKPDDLSAGVYVLQQTIGFMFQAALRAAAKLNLAEHLESGPKTSEQLAQELGCRERTIRQILRLLASHRIFISLGDSRFALNPEAEFLKADHPFSLRQAILMVTDQTFWMPSYQLSDIALKKPVFEDLFGGSFFEYWEKNANLPDNFHNGMSSFSAIENNSVVRHYDFNENIVVADIAGGFGGLLLEVLKNNPTVQGILFDREHVLENNILHLLEDDSRWETCPGSFFEKCPEADIFLLKYISHDWPDDKVVEILKTIRRAMKQSSKLLLIDCVIGDDDKPYFGKELDLLCINLSADGGGHTKAEFEALFAKSGLKLNRIIDTDTHVYIIEVLPV
ncbi:methyltransferase [Providencia rettgeri]|uniref:methyltransferase n=1 Tax=Providencia rettgeri TaxID=587 RepID=UPI0010135B60|nr:methyltransferase [Providencia rettgeri]RXN73361.1 methyltransferase [Providencia rettgeri]